MRDIYEGVDSEGYGPGKDGGGGGGGGLRLDPNGDVRETTGGVRKIIFHCAVLFLAALTLTGCRTLAPTDNRGAEDICSGANPPAHCAPKGPSDAERQAVATAMRYIADAVRSAKCKVEPISIGLVCLQYAQEPALLIDCVDAAIVGQCGSTPSPSPRPQETATVASPQPATPSPSPTAPTEAPTVAAPTLETAIPISGECVKGRPSVFTQNVRDAIATVKAAHPEWFYPDRPRLIGWPGKDGIVQLRFDSAVVQALRAQGLDAAVDNCQCDQIAVAYRGDATFHEDYAIAVSGGDIRDPGFGGGYLERCEPRGFPADAPAPATPAPSPTSGQTWSTVPPVIDKVNGANAEPGSVGFNGVVGFTLFYQCPKCDNHKAWPADQDHAHWTPPAGSPIGSDGQPHAHYGTCPGDGSDSDRTCQTFKGRAWDATCASVGSFIVPMYPGNVRLDPRPGRNCYAGILNGSGEYRVCLPAGAMACVDPHDYDQPETWEQGCAHGEVELTDHAVCSGPYRVDR